MRIGTWNMEGKRSDRHLAFLAGLACDALLLTEVPLGLELGSGALVHSAPMGTRKHWAAVWTARPAASCPSPHDWSAASRLDGILLVATILPWRGAGRHWNGPEPDTATRTAAVLDALEPLLRSAGGPVLFGGDFNHALVGPEYAGSLKGRAAIDRFLDGLGLHAPTTGLSHRSDGAFSIDHVTIPRSWQVRTSERVVAVDEHGKRLSDHDAYVVDAVPAVAAL